MKIPPKQSKPTVTVFDRIILTLLAHGPLNDNDIVRQLTDVKSTSTKATITRGIQTGLFNRLDTSQDAVTGRYVRRVELNRASPKMRGLAA